MCPNHVIDPTFFFDAILEFAFDYDWYAMKGYELDDMKRRIAKFDKLSISGSSVISYTIKTDISM